MSPAIFCLSTLDTNFILTMKGGNIFLLLSCLKLTGFLFATVLILCLSLYQLIFVSCLALGLFLAVAKISVKRASISTVDSVLGPLGDTVLSEGKKAEKLRVIAHRACGLDAPENSLYALKKIIKEGIKAVEFDIMLTSDNVPVVFHDDTLSRMTDSSELLKNVCFQDLQVLDLSKKHPFGKFCPGEKIPKMDAFIQCCLDNDIKMLFDLKDDRLVPYIVESFEKFPNLVDVALVSSFNPLLIYKIRKANDKITGCLAWRPYYYSHAEYTAENGPKKPYSTNWFISIYHRFSNFAYEWLLCQFIYHILGISAILLHKDMITRNYINHWKNRGVRVLAWTVNSPSEKLFFERVFQIPYLTDTTITMDK